MAANPLSMIRPRGEAARSTLYRSGSVAAGAEILSPFIDCRGIAALGIVATNNDGVATRTLDAIFYDEDQVAMLTASLFVVPINTIARGVVGNKAVNGGSFTQGLLLSPFMKVKLNAGGSSTGILDVWGEAA